jgi:hypothetical protein
MVFTPSRLEVLHEKKKLLTDSDICFGDNPTRTWGQFFSNVFMLFVLLFLLSVLFNNVVKS